MSWGKFSWLSAWAKRAYCLETGGLVNTVATAAAQRLAWPVMLTWGAEDGNAA